MPLGYPASAQTVGGVAAPLLAGAAFTMTALLLTPADASALGPRWTDVALTLFIGAGLLLVATVQASLWARRYMTDPQELADWYPEQIGDGKPNDWLRTVQGSYARRAGPWNKWTRYLYNAGILLLLAGVAVAVIPAGEIAATRWIPIAVAWSGLAAELTWLAVIVLTRNRP